MPTVVTKENYDKEVIRSDRPVVIEVYADWCGPCQQMMPIFEELEKEHSAYKFAKVNVDEARDLAVQFGVTSVPTFIFIKEGEMKGKETGYVAKEDLLMKIQELLD